MNILLITAYFPPDTGSAASLFYELGCRLVRKGHVVTVLTSFPSYHVRGNTKHYDGEKCVRENIDGVSVLRLRVPQLSRNIPALRGFRQFAMAYRFSRVVARMKEHDVALVYSPPLPLGLAAASLKKNSTPLVLNVQDLFPRSAVDLKILRNTVLIRLFEYLERRIYGLADHITVHSPGNRHHVAGAGVDSRDVTVVPNWVDTDFVRPGQKPNSFSRRHKLDNRFVVSFAGVIGYSQDIDVVLRAARLLRQKKEILFLIVGDGVEKPRLIDKAERMALDNVRFMPMQPRAAYPLILQSSDVCLATLNQEVRSPVVPSKILSIMASRKPLIACMDSGGDAANVVRDADCGFVYPAGDHKGLAEAVCKLYDSPVLRERLGANGRAFCESNFSLDTCADKYVELFERIVK